MHFFRTNEHQPLRIPKTERLWRSFLRLDSTIRHLIVVCIEISEREWCYSLRFKTWEYFVERPFEVRDKDHWFWVELLPRWESVYLYLEQVLQSTGDHSWDPLYSLHWHVELWMHYGWIRDGLPNLSRRGWNGLVEFDHGGCGYSFKWSLSAKLKEN